MLCSSNCSLNPPSKLKLISNEVKHINAVKINHNKHYKAKESIFQVFCFIMFNFDKKDSKKNFYKKN